jgi:hypothetical protein
MSTCLVPPDSATTSPKRSGGPRTVEGKENSRRNALKRGLRSKIVFPDDVADLVEERTRAFFAEFTPRSTYEEVLVRDMAVSSVRFERCASLSVADLVRSVDRAEHCWEHDRRMSVEHYASRLSKDPKRISRGLRRSRQGTEWLIECWEMLGEIAHEIGRWDDDQRRLAFDMLGVPRELRSGTTRVPGGDDTPALVALVESQVAMLRDDLEAVLDDLNDAEQAMSMSGMPLEEDVATARLRKDEARARNDFLKARNELIRTRESRTTEEARPQPPSTTDRPPLSNAAIDNLVKRSRWSMEILDAVVEEDVVEEEEKEVVVIDEPEPEPEEEVSPEPAASRPNRRARKEQARRARAANRREVGTR